MVTVRTVSLTVTLGGTILIDVESARGEIVADSGWPTCSVFVKSYPYVDNDPIGTPEDPAIPLDEGQPIEVVAGAGNDVVRFTGRVRRFRPSAFPKAIEIVATGTLAYANEWSPATDFRFGHNEEFPDGSVGFFPDGATDQEIIQFVLDQVPNVSYDAGNIDGTGVTLGTSAPSAFDWKAGTTAWSYIQELDRATLYRTYQDRTGEIRRVRMIGHPNSTEDFTLAPGDMLDGSSASRDTERTRNAVEVRAHDYGSGAGPFLGSAYGSNSFQGDGADPAKRHVEVFDSDLIESGNDALGNPFDLGGLVADDIAATILPDVDKEFVEAGIPSWRDDTHGPGLTCLVNALDRLRVEEPMWVQRYGWEVGENGWVATYGLTGGGLPQDYTPPPV